jgi:hypothetical protein
MTDQFGFAETTDKFTQVRVVQSSNVVGRDIEHCAWLLLGLREGVAQFYPVRLLNPEKLWSRVEIFASPCPVPRERGVYAWYFRKVPIQVPLAGCLRHGDHTLLYVGIAPGRVASQQTLEPDSVSLPWKRSRLDVAIDPWVSPG